MKKLTALVLSFVMVFSVCADALAGVLTLPAALKVIEKQTFYGNESLDAVVIQEGTERIEEEAFAYSSLTEVTIPDTVTDIAENAFDGADHAVIHANRGTMAYVYAAYHGLLPEIEMPMITLGENQIIIPDGDACVCVPFVAPQNGRFTFSSSGNHDTMCEILNNGREPLADDDNSGENGNFNLSWLLEKGQLVYLRISLLDENSAGDNLLVKVSKVESDKADGSCGDGLTWHLENMVLTISGNGDMAFEDDTIPWENYSYDLFQVVIENGVTGIAPYAFMYAENVKQVVIPDSMRIIGEYAFYKCYSLEKVVIPQGVSSIGEYAFGDCYVLRSVIIPDSVTDVGNHTFASCRRLETATLGSGVTTVSESMFAGSGIKQIAIPATVTEIGENSFSATALKQVTFQGTMEQWQKIIIRSGNAKLMYSADIYCADGIIKATSSGSFGTMNWRVMGDILYIDADGPIPEEAELAGVMYSIEELVYYVFSELNICHVIVDEGVTEIPPRMFVDQYALETVSLPSTLIKLGRGAFSRCYSLINVNIPSMLTAIQEETFQATSLKSIELPVGLTVIGDDAFFGTEIESLRLPDSLATIGNNAFAFCENLTTVLIPSSVKTIGENAFRATGLTAVVINEGVETIAAYAFDGCYNLQEVTIPKSVQTIGTDAFDAERICDMTFHTVSNSYAERWIDEQIKLNTFYFITFELNGGALSENLWSHYQYGFVVELPIPVKDGYIFEGWLVNGERATEVVMDQDITAEAIWKPILRSYTLSLDLNGGNLSIEIAEQYEEGSVVTLPIPAKVGYIFEGWLVNGERATEVVMDQDITAEATWTIGGKCGDNLMWTLSDDGCLEISGTGDMYDYVGNAYPWQVNTIPWCDYSSDLKKLILNEGITSIGQWAFCNCAFSGNLVIPDSVTSIGNGAFWGCSGFTDSLVIPDSVTNIGGFAFRGCSGFTGSLVIPDSVTIIRVQAFQLCNGFTGSLVIPDGVTSIEDVAFRYCSGFTGNLVIPDSVTSIGIQAFYDCSGFTGSLVIPGSVTSIGNGAFCGCKGFDGNLVISEGVTVIGNYAFSGCQGFTDSLIIPNSVTIIGYAAFQTCSGFTGSLAIPDSVTIIGDGAFNYCTGFNGSLVIPDSVTSIGIWAFLNNSLWEKVYISGNVSELDEVLSKQYEKDLETGEQKIVGPVICAKAGTYALAWAQSEGFPTEIVPGVPTQPSTTPTLAASLSKTTFTPGEEIEINVTYGNVVKVHYNNGDNDFNPNSWEATGIHFGDLLFDQESSGTQTVKLTAQQTPGKYHVTLWAASATGEHANENVPVTLEYTVEESSTIFFSMSASEIKTNVDVQFDIIAPDCDTVYMYVDGVHYWEDQIQVAEDSSASFARAFTKAGLRKIHFVGYKGGNRVASSEMQTLVVLCNDDNDTFGPISNLTATGVLTPSFELTPEDVLHVGDTMTVSWDAVENAAGYKVYIYGPDASLVSTQLVSSSAAFSQWIITQEGNYYIEVIAFGEGYSQISNSVSTKAFKRGFTNEVPTSHVVGETHYSYLQCEKADTFDPSTNRKNGGHVNCVDPIVVLAQENGYYYIVMKKDTGDFDFRYISKSVPLGSSQYSPRAIIHNVLCCQENDGHYIVTVIANEYANGIFLSIDDNNAPYEAFPLASGNLKKYVFQIALSTSGATVRVWITDFTGQVAQEWPLIVIETERPDESDLTKIPEDAQIEAQFMIQSRYNSFLLDTATNIFEPLSGMSLASSTDSLSVKVTMPNAFEAEAIDVFVMHQDTNLKQRTYRYLETQYTVIDQDSFCYVSEFELSYTASLLADNTAITQTDSYGNEYHRYDCEFVFIPARFVKHENSQPSVDEAKLKILESAKAAYSLRGYFLMFEELEAINQPCEVIPTATIQYHKSVFESTESRDINSRINGFSPVVCRYIHPTTGQIYAAIVISTQHGNLFYSLTPDQYHAITQNVKMTLHQYQIKLETLGSLLISPWGLSVCYNTSNGLRPNNEANYLIVRWMKGEKYQYARTNSWILPSQPDAKRSFDFNEDFFDFPTGQPISLPKYTQYEVTVASIPHDYSLTWYENAQYFFSFYLTDENEFVQYYKLLKYAWTNQLNPLTGQKYDATSIDTFDYSPKMFNRLLKNYYSQFGFQDDAQTLIIEMLENAPKEAVFSYLITLRQYYFKLLPYSNGPSHYRGKSFNEDYISFTKNTYNVLNGPTDFKTTFFHESGHAVDGVSGRLTNDSSVRKAMKLDFKRLVFILMNDGTVETGDKVIDAQGSAPAFTRQQADAIAQYWMDVNRDKNKRSHILEYYGRSALLGQYSDDEEKRWGTIETEAAVKVGRFCTESYFGDPLRDAEMWIDSMIEGLTYQYEKFGTKTHGYNYWYPVGNAGIRYDPGLQEMEAWAEFFSGRLIKYTKPDPDIYNKLTMPNTYELFERLEKENLNKLIRKYF